MPGTFKGLVMPHILSLLQHISIVHAPHLLTGGSIVLFLFEVQRWKRLMGWSHYAFKTVLRPSQDVRR